MILQINAGYKSTLGHFFGGYLNVSSQQYRYSRLLIIIHDVYHSDDLKLNTSVFTEPA